MSLTHTDSAGNVYGLGLMPATEQQKRAVCALHEGGNLPRSQWQEVSYLAYVPDRYDQGQQGSCVGHGGVGSLVTLRAMHGLGRERLSPCNLYGQINGGQDHGALVVDALKALRDGAGVCLESTVGPTHWQPASWPASWKEEASRFKLEKATEIRGFDAIGTALMEGDPVCFGIEIGQAFEPDGQGVVPDRRGSGGGHCMFTVGLKQFSSRWYAQVVNSWGTRWGSNGICYLPESYFAGWHEAYRLKTSIDNPQGDNPPNVKGS